MEMQDKDDSHEEEAALASPVKGSESQKMSKVFHRIFKKILTDAD